MLTQYVILRAVELCPPQCERVHNSKIPRKVLINALPEMWIFQIFGNTANQDNPIHTYPENLFIYEHRLKPNGARFFSQEIRLAFLFIFLVIIRRWE